MSLLTALSPLTAPSLLIALLTDTFPSAAAPSPVPALCQGTGGDMAMLGCYSHMQTLGRRGMFKGG